MSPKYRLGIDIGGTFTDFTLLDQETGEIFSHKTPTVPHDPAKGVLNGLTYLVEQKEVQPSDITYFVHGTTIGLNTLLQRNGSKIALFVTEGFRDLLALQRLRLPVPYDFRSRLPEPLVPRKRVFPIRERLWKDGTTRLPLDFDTLNAAIDAAIEEKVEGIAICFLHSYKNPIHEEMAAAAIHERVPEIPVVISSSVWPQMREYERATMTVLNLYIQRRMLQYFRNLKSELERARITVTPYITQSNGGIMDLQAASEAPIRTLLSGPAAGVIGAARVAKAAGFDNVITIDMGGTSADISIIQNGRPKYTPSSELDGFPIMLPTIFVSSIGAGGGSVAWIDKGGILKVGPDSVGADPGPACYGRGMQPTLTDAFLLCGYLNPDQFAGGLMKLDPQRSAEAMRPIAEYLHQSVEMASDRIIQVAVANMYTDVSSVMEQQGFDPREFTLVAFGGAGPVTANFLADEIQANSVLVPLHPGTLCALGSLTADFMYDAIRSRQSVLSEISTEELRGEFLRLAEQAKTWLEQQHGSHVQSMELVYSLDARYKGQAYDIELQLDPKWLEEPTHAKIMERFHDVYRKQYGHYNAGGTVEVINLRVRIIGNTHKPPLSTVSPATASPRPSASRQILFRGKTYAAEVYPRSGLRAGHHFRGPAIVEQSDTTVLILPGWEARVDTYGNLLITRPQQTNFGSH
ncbi:hydantoinase/oxoprolinase family protein [Alicyclobacillus kakegawensis]|uniref:hydantoinase/oxoprolinase family protein n=1 Tax=Alicyclobacillus kakegawensis TaxID=392012 RepID=UPI000830FAB8|nr:hydantoinase/oxoprolinase family protein [Alicyclobacillus kakegawensis]